MAICAVRFASNRFLDHGSAIQDKILTFLVQDSEAVESQRISKQIDWRIGLFDNTEERAGVGNRNGTTLGAAAEIFKEQFELLRQVIRGQEIFGHLARGVAGQNEALVALPLEKDSFEDVLT